MGERVGGTEELDELGELDELDELGELDELDELDELEELDELREVRIAISKANNACISTLTKSISMFVLLVPCRDKCGRLIVCGTMFLMSPPFRLICRAIIPIVQCKFSLARRIGALARITVPEATNVGKFVVGVRPI